jgi:hypothetical protein
MTRLPLAAFLLISLWIPIAACAARTICDYFGVTNP